VAVRVSAVVSLDTESVAERLRTVEQAETTAAEFRVDDPSRAEDDTGSVSGLMSGREHPLAVLTGR
jgi:hypothetical protein